MRKSKTGLLDTIKIDYTTKDGIPTIEISAAMTTRAQVEVVVEQLNKLAAVLPDARVRKPKKTTTARATRPVNNAETYGT